MSELTIATFNVRQAPAKDGPNSWPLRRELFLDVARGLEADVLGTQEPFEEQVEALAGALSGYQVVGVGRSDGRRAGEWSAIFVRRSRLSVVEQGNFWLSPTPEVPGSKGWDAQSHPRLCTWALLSDRVSDQQVFVCNSHWDHEGELARRHSAGMIASWLGKRSKGIPAVVTGDFNCEPDSAPIRYLTGRAENPEIAGGEDTAYPATPCLTDTWAVLHPETPYERTFHGFRGPGAPGGRIDYILTTPGLTVKSCQIVHAHDDGRWPSDHFPVVARVAWDA